jgi:hypothetical protein
MKPGAVQIVHAANAKVALGYTGLATLDGIRSDLWFHRELMAFEPWRHPWPAAVDFLAGQLDAAGARNHALRAHELTLTLTGLGVLDGGGTSLAIANISNVDARRGRFGRSVGAEVGRPFQISIFNAANPRNPRMYYLEAAGAFGMTSSFGSMRRRLSRQLRSAATREERLEVVKSIVSMMREQRQASDRAAVIGDRWTAVLIEQDLQSVSTYFSDSDVTPLVPNLVSRDGRSLGQSDV